MDKAADSGIYGVGFTFILAVVMLAGGASGQYGGGSGTSEEPYLIGDANHLFALAGDPCDYDRHFRLIADLDLDPCVTGIAPLTTALIAPDVDPAVRRFQGVTFTGSFDGDNHTISNLVIDSGGTGNDFLGLFGKTEPCAVITELGLENVRVTVGNYAEYIGMLCGRSEGNISDSYATGSVSTGSNCGLVGGLCGRNTGSLERCYAGVNAISGDRADDIGGLCGANSGGTVIDCYAEGTVEGGDNANDLGGLCGSNDDSISDSHASVSVTGGVGANSIGGLCGFHGGGTITNCYATGAVTGGEDSYFVGGLCGYNYRGSIVDCHATGAVSGGKDSWDLGGLCGHNIYFSRAVGIMGCHATGSVTGGYGAQNLGGLCGYNNSGAIYKCYATGTVGAGENAAMYLGGLCGRNEDLLISCYATGNVQGGGNCGGLCGLNYSTWASIDKCYATGSVTGGGVLGGLCGINNEGAITNSYATGGVSTGDSAGTLGGLCGYNSTGPIYNCGASGAIIAGDDCMLLGGLCGYNSEGAITQSRATGNISAGDRARAIGGVCGWNERGSITDCYATGSLTVGMDPQEVGGVCGMNADYTLTTSSVINRCYSGGSVNVGHGASCIGAVCGWHNGAISNCFWDMQVSGQSVAVGCNEGGEITSVFGKSNYEMQLESTFTDLDWDFGGEGTAGTWRLCLDGINYPRLGWEYKDGDLVCPDGVNLLDFAFFAAHWLRSDCFWPYNCSGADLDEDTHVDTDDVVVLANHWLTGQRAPGPVIGVWPREIELCVLEDACSPAPTTLFVHAGGIGTLHWEVTHGCSWVTVDPVMGVTNGEPNEVIVSVDTHDLAAGQYDCELSISDPCAANTPETVHIRLTIDDAVLDVPSEYGTIQAAIDAAAEGATVAVWPGTYVENINLNGKNIIVSSNDVDDPCVVAGTVIQGTGSGPVVAFTGSETSSCVLSGFTIMGGSSADGAGIYGNGTGATISRCTVSGNSATGNGGGINDCVGVISDCVISNNSAGNIGGGLRWCNGEIRRCIITGNDANKGGGLAGSHAEIVSCIIANNSAPDGAGLYNCDGTISNCSIASNSGATCAGLRGCNGPIANCIIWGNNGPDIFEGSVPTYSCYAGGTGSNIDVDPCFVDAAAGDYHLRWDSGCIDAGDPAGGAGEVDIGGAARVVDGDCDGSALVDMGAYEFSYAYMGDLDHDCAVDLRDFVMFQAAWQSRAGEDNYNGECDMAVPGDELIDLRDLAVLATHWLGRVRP